MHSLPSAVRNKALVAGATRWLEELPDLLLELERDWHIKVGDAFDDATEALVAEATLDDGTSAVLKLVVPRAGDAARNEIIALRLAGGEGCVPLIREDESRGALLLPRLGRSLHHLGLPIQRRLEILCATVEPLWRPAPGCGLPTGAEKGRWLARHIERTWDESNRPCSERAVDHALACAERRISSHDEERAVLVHGDVHQWNALEAGDAFKLVDPDGLLAEAEYDLGILMREDPLEILEGHPYDRALWLAHRTGLDAQAIWEWGCVERVSNGLVCTQIDLQPVGRQMLAAADQIATKDRLQR